MEVSVSAGPADRRMPRWSRAAPAATLGALISGEVMKLPRSYLLPFSRWGTPLVIQSGAGSPLR